MPPQEGYADLPRKTLLFFETVLRQYDPQYIVKVDDDVYLRLDRVPAAVEQWASVGAGGALLGQAGGGVASLVPLADLSW